MSLDEKYDEPAFPKAEPIGAANAGRARPFQSSATGPAWLASSFGMTSHRAFIWSMVFLGPVPLTAWLGKAAYPTLSILATGLASVAGIWFLLWAAVLEKAHGETSGTISPRVTLAILGGVIAWVTIVVCRTLLD